MFIDDARYILLGIFGKNYQVVIKALENSDALVNIFNNIIVKKIKINISPNDINPEYNPVKKIITIPDYLVRDIRNATIVGGDISLIADKITEFASVLAHESIHADLATNGGPYSLSPKAYGNIVEYVNSIIEEEAIAYKGDWIVSQKINAQIGSNYNPKWQSSINEALIGLDENTAAWNTALDRRFLSIVSDISLNGKPDGITYEMHTVLERAVTFDMIEKDNFVKNLSRNNIVLDYLPDGNVKLTVQSVQGISSREVGTLSNVESIVLNKGKVLLNEIYGIVSDSSVNTTSLLDKLSSRAIDETKIIAEKTMHIIENEKTIRSLPGAQSIADKFGKAALAVGVLLTVTEIWADVEKGDYEKAADASGRFGSGILLGMAGGIAGSIGVDAALYVGASLGLAFAASPPAILIIAATTLAGFAGGLLGEAAWENVVKPKTEALLQYLLDMQQIDAAILNPDYSTQYPILSAIADTAPFLRKDAYIAYKSASTLYKVAFLDPIVIDIAGDGIKINDLNRNSPSFDFSSNHHAQQTSWIESGNGFLARVQADGLVHNGNDLIATFDQLKALDVNNDGVLRSSDPDFNQLIVWQDINADGVCESNEISSLNSLGIQRIALNASQTSQQIGNNAIVETSLVTMVDGSTREIAAVNLTTDQMNTAYTGNDGINPLALSLPQIDGYGTVNSLRVQMSIDPTLLAQVSALTKMDASDITTFNLAIKTIMFEWANVQDIPQPNNASFDIKKYGFLHNFFGASQSFWGTSYPSLSVHADLLETSWETTFQAVKARFVVQLPGDQMAQQFFYDTRDDLVLPDQNFNQSITNASALIGNQAQPGKWLELATLLNESIRELNSYIPQNSAGILASFQQNFPAFFTNDVLQAISTGTLNIVEGYGSNSELNSTGNATNLFIIDQPDQTVSLYNGTDEIVIVNGAENITIKANASFISKATIQLDQAYQRSNLSFSGNAQGDLLVYNDSSVLLTLKGALINQQPFSSILLKLWNGSTLSLDDMITGEKSSTLNQSEILYGTQGVDTLDGMGITHKLVGNGGGDTFVYNQGYGSLEIGEKDADPNNSNTLDLGTGITINDINVTSDQTGNMILNINSEGSIRLNGMLESSDQGISQIRLADGTMLTRQQLLTMANTGSVTNTSITSWLANQIIDPAGYAGSIHLAGGNSLVKFNPGYGRIEINQHDANPADQNTLLFGAGINPADIVISTDGTGNILLTIGSGDCVVLDNMAVSPASGVQVVRFTDGTSWSAATIVSQVDTTVQGYYTTYDFNRGMGNIVISASGISGIAFGAGVSINDLSIETNRAGDLIITTSNNDSLTLIGSVRTYAANLFRTELSVQQLSFADGSTLAMGSTPTFIHRSNSIGTNNANNTFYLNSKDALIKGGTTTQANTEINTIVMNRGIGQVTADLTGGIGIIRIGASIKQSDILVQSTDSGDLTVKIASTGDSLLVRNGMYMTPYGPSSLIQSIQFSDGSQIPVSLQGFTPTPLTYSWIGVGDGKIMVGSDWGKNTFIVGPNNAQIVAGTGSHYNATGTFNYNTFLYDTGDGNAVIDVTNASGEIDLAPDVLRDSVIYQTDNAGSLIVKFLGDPQDSITLKNDIYSTPYGLTSRISKIAFDDGTHTDLNLTGPNAINFTWTGNSVGSNYGTNIYDLGRNGASVIAGNGSNTVQFDRGDGKAIVDFANTVNSNTSQNTVRIMAIIQSKDILFRTDGNDLIVGIKGDPNDTLILKGDIARNFYGPMSTVQSLNFADGTVMPINFIGSNAISFTWSGSAVGSDYGANTFYLHSSLAKTISAGNGSESGVYPVSNQNTFIFGMGSGSTTVTLRGGVGSIVMADGITPDQVLFQANNSGDLTVGLKTDLSSKVTFLSDLVQNWFGVTSAINQIKFSDGTVQNLGVVNYQNNPIPFTWTATASNTVLTGSNYGLNVFNTAPGNDHITTGNGNNTFNYTPGDGVVNVDISQGTGLLNLKGLSLSDTYFQASDDGSLQVNFRSSPMDSIRFMHDVTNNWWGVASALSSVRSDDGSTMAIGSPYYNQGTPIQSTWLGTDIDQTFTGTHFGLNTFQLSSANDTVNSVNNDTVIAGSGNSIVHANGSTINISTTQGSTSLDGSAIATVNMAGGSLNYSGVGGLIANVTADSSITILNGSNDQISTLENTHNHIQLGSGNSIVFSHGNDFIEGGSLGGNDIINGGSGLMTFFGGSNPDTLQIGTGGLNFTLGTAHSEIIEYGSSGASLYNVVQAITGGDATINNFRSGIDLISLHGFSAGEINGAIAGQNQQGNKVDLSFSNGSHLALTGIQSISSNDFRVL